MEIELKLSIDPHDVAAFLRHPFLQLYASARPRRQWLRNTYFDTPDCYLQRHDCGLRVRQSGDALIQTLKGGGSVAAGLHQRLEWEAPVAQPQPDLALLRAQVGAGPFGVVLADARLDDALEAAFSTDFERTAWLLRSAQGDLVELALDQGSISRGALSVPICEIELELKEGNPACLFELAQVLAETIPLRLGHASKAERGYRLLAARTAQPVRAQALVLARDASAGQALGAMLTNCLQQIQGNEEALQAGDDPEAVHQMRVGVRRLRSALGLFARQAPLPEALDAQLRWLADTLGAARDWEVLAHETLPELVQACPGQTGLDALQAAVAALAAQRRAQVQQAIASARYTALWLALGRWSMGALAALPAPVEALASQTVRRYQKKLAARAARVGGGDPLRRHRMRIAAKRLRYALEFFRSLYPPKAVKRYIAHLSQLQQDLGVLNDAVVAARLLRAPELLQGPQASDELAFGAAFVCGYLAQQGAHADEVLARQWRRFEHTVFSA